MNNTANLSRIAQIDYENLIDGLRVRLTELESLPRGRSVKIPGTNMRVSYREAMESHPRILAEIAEIQTILGYDY